MRRDLKVAKASYRSWMMLENMIFSWLRRVGEDEESVENVGREVKLGCVGYGPDEVLEKVRKRESMGKEGVVAGHAK